MRRSKPSRRQFLRGTVAATAGLAAASLVSPRVRAASSSGKIVMGMMGTGGRGVWLLQQELIKREGIEIAYLCDVDEGRLKSAADLVEKARGRRPKTVSDFRRILDDKDVNVVFNVTPDHWHALGTILACQAGKDVYVEKPASHNPWEGRKMVEAARKYHRVVQHGTQTRSGDYAAAAVEYLRSGKLGDVHLVRVLNMKLWPPIGRKADGPVPAGVDYDAWLGPAPMRAFNANRFHYSWHWFWDYSGGDIINDGIHQIDFARWLIGKDYPKSVWATGSRVYDHDGEAPDTQVVTWDYGGLTMVFELTLRVPYMKKMPWELRDGDTYPHWPFDGMRVEVHGTKGLMFAERHGGGWQVYDDSEKVIAQQNGHHPHVAHLDNFFRCVETRERPNADIEEGHRSTLLSQMGNISYRVGGRQLRFDAKTETFMEDAEANALLKRAGRDEWIVPEAV
ncbi:MAG: Gfo/Idh/MocA family oxidoreductase [Phycisphaerae bacterium]|nr:Gfo/Idh/MocA family oxidoreductase [Phycisphaerae bacterium]